MKIVIIEDEPLVANDIRKLVQRLEPEASVLAILTSVEMCRRWFSKNDHPDLILSDIQLSDGTSFEVFETAPVQCPIIFTTAYDDYAIRAFKLNSIDYLLKPVDEAELARALQKYKNLASSSQFGEQLRQMMSHWGRGMSMYKERFLVMRGNAMVPVNQTGIAYFHKDQLIFLHTMDNEKFICEFSALDDVEELLNPEFFFRVNRQYIIHVQSVAKLRTTHKGVTVMLKSPLDVEIDISREKAGLFRKWLG
jgi:two-component system, LytTR family, response regulator